VKISELNLTIPELFFSQSCWFFSSLEY